MMKGLFTRISNTRFFRVVKSQWWIGILTGFFTGLAVFPPNIINFNRVTGNISKTYNKIEWVHVKGKGSVPFPTVFIVLSDSVIFNSADKKCIEYIEANNVIGKKVNIIYIEREVGDKSISKLTIDNQVVGDEDKRLVFIFFASVIWVLVGGMAEIIRIWKSV